DDPEIISRGFVYMRSATDLVDLIRSTVTEVLSASHGQNGKRRERLQENLSRVLYNETRRRPMIFTVINDR
ncbi:MAG: hypothetical protein JNM70_24910, partial [Anaerolineae bacterium]|nr:hypothetical protein [Anaerolineae bacterium]